jgi:hypothetical protein
MSKSIVANNAEKVKEFTPTPAMEKWLDTQIEIKSDSPKKISEHCSLSREVWYRWLEKKGFEDWYYAEYEKKIRRYRPRLDAIGMKESEKGSYNHWKDMQRFAGRVETPQQTTHIQIPIFNVMTKEAKAELTDLYEGSNSTND